MDTFDLIAHRQSPSLTEAWTAMYTALADHRWHPASELVAVVVHHGVSAAAARALLGDAVKSGRLQIGTDEESGTRGFRLTPGPYRVQRGPGDGGLPTSP